MKAILAVILVLVLAVAGYVLYARHKVQLAISGPAREIVTESMTKSGNTWNVEFVSKFDAPVDRVYEAFSKPERSKELAPENFLKSELIKEDGNTKLVEIVAKLDILPPGFKVQTVKTEWTFFPGERRITSHTESKVADIDAEYKFEPTPDGKGTILRFSEKSLDKGAIPIEDVQRGALREVYITQVKIANKSLGLGVPQQKDAS